MEPGSHRRSSSTFRSRLAEQAPAFRFSAWLFQKLLAGIYVIAFASLLPQVRGLIGENGLQPFPLILQNAALAGLKRYYIYPTLLWLKPDDFGLLAVTWAGVTAGLVALCTRHMKAAFIACWLCYLSVVTVDDVFLSFQWDALLLEAGFLAIFLSPTWRTDRSSVPRFVFLLLLRWLLFRLMFSSGYVKLASGDKTWRDLTALTYHYLTQPLPNRVAYYAYRLPKELHTASTVVMFFIELVCPFFVFAPRRLRHLAAGALVFLQVLILTTGNYTFFNLLAIALILLILDDRALARLMRRSPPAAAVDAPAPPSKRRRPAIIASTAAATVVLASAAHLWLTLDPAHVPRIALRVAIDTSPFHLGNSYGLFAVMTTSRREIVIEGSDDGEHWLEYPFKWKPQDIRTPPRQAAPYQPRLDWQMWFAALSPVETNIWFARLILGIFHGSPEVLGLLGGNPFPDKPPAYLRALLYDYRFSTLDERRQTGAWWHRELVGEYLGPVRPPSPADAGP